MTLELIGRLVPWALGAAGGLLTILGVLPDWWTTITAAVIGIVQVVVGRKR